MSILYLVATPIGNLGDFSTRAVEVLRQVDQIACEDTRFSGTLLKHYQIETPTFPFHQHNEHQKVKHLINLLDGGQNIALITDAGMPGISDPGFLAARAAHRGSHTVTVIPGPDACTTALVASGLPCDRFFFEGFLPPKKGRQTRLRELCEMDVTTVIYESPHRFGRLLDELAEHAEGGRLICIARELTKKFEEVQRGNLAELREHWNNRDAPKGEFVIVMAGKSYSESE
ncbi:MAG: 16S rRNA (cytidine(1402)-2'-O)-methyltransferase [Balneolaceae bacterium]